MLEEPFARRHEVAPRGAKLRQIPPGVSWICIRMQYERRLAEGWISIRTSPPREYRVACGLVGVHVHYWVPCCVKAVLCTSYALILARNQAQEDSALTVHVY